MVTKAQRGTNRKLLTRKQLAKALNYNERTIAKLQDEGMPVAVRGRGGAPSQFDEAEVRKFLRERADKKPADQGNKSFFAERAEKERWQGLLAKQQYLTRQRELLPRQEVERAWGAEVTAVRTKLLSWSTTIADQVHRVSTLEGLPGVERVLNDAVRDVLRELASPPEAEKPPKKGRRRKDRAVA